MYLVLTGVAVIFACAASLSLVLLSFFDTYRHHERHGQLLLSCFLGLTMSAFCTSVVYFPYLRRRTKYGYLRHWYDLALCLVVEGDVTYVLTIQLHP